MCPLCSHRRHRIIERLCCGRTFAHEVCCSSTATNVIARNPKTTACCRCSRQACGYLLVFKMCVHSALTGGIVYRNDCAAEGGLHVWFVLTLLQLTPLLVLQRLITRCRCVVNRCSIKSMQYLHTLVVGVSYEFRAC